MVKPSDERIQCELCLVFFQQITSTHLKNRHSITVDEYKNMFPNSIIFRESSKKILGENVKNNPNAGFKKGVKHNFKTNPWNRGLNKEDKRVLNNSRHMIGRIVSAETKKKLSETKTFLIKYDFCSECGVKKGKTTRKLCVTCAQRKRVSNPDFINGMKGKKLSKEHLDKFHAPQNLKMTKPEIAVLDAFGLFGLRYTGNRQKWVTFKCGVRKNPDFVFGNEKIAIEVFGDYWHKGEDPDLLIEKYNQIGWRCLVLWESEIFKDHNLTVRINNFINKNGYEAISGRFDS